MRLVVDRGIRHGVATRRNRLVTAGSPAAIDIQTAHGSEPHDGAGIRSDVHRAGPLAHELQAAEAGEELEGRGEDAACDVIAAALAIRVEHIGTPADDDPAPIALTHIGMDGGRYDNG